MNEIDKFLFPILFDQVAPWFWSAGDGICFKINESGKPLKEFKWVLIRENLHEHKLLGYSV